MGTPEKTSRQLRLPIHDFAEEHKVLRAVKRYKTKERLETAEERTPCAEVAARRIREFAYDLGADLEWYRWMAEVARRMGLNYHTCRSIIIGEKTFVGPKVVDQIARATGCPVSVFYDEEF